MFVLACHYKLLKGLLPAYGISLGKSFTYKNLECRVVLIKHTTRSGCLNKATKNSMNTKNMIALQYACNTLAMELAEMAGYSVATLQDDLEKSIFFQQKMDYINTLKTRIVTMCGGVMPHDSVSSSQECDTSPSDSSTGLPSQ